jgi:hypothetical protein
VKLSAHEGMKRKEVGKNIRHMTKRECPCKMRIII